MKKSLSGLALLVVLAVTPIAAQAQGKVGVINMNAAIGNTEEGKKAIADLERKFAPRRSELQHLQQEIQDMQDKLSKQQATLSDDEQRQLSRDIEEKQRNFKRMADDAQQDYNADTEDSIRRIGQKMVKVINDYAAQNGFVLVIDDAQVPIYYASKDAEISNEIVKRYDAAYPLAAAATTAPKPAAAASHP
jgi:outer membrane protein